MFNRSVFAITRFRDSEGDLVGQLETVAAYWRDKPGNLSVDVLRNIDDPELVALVSKWVNIGAYRAALGGQEGKLFLTPMLLKAIDEPSAYLLADEW